MWRFRCGCSNVWAHDYLCLRACWAQRIALVSLTSTTYSCFLRQGLSLNLEVTEAARLTGRQELGITGRPCLAFCMGATYLNSGLCTRMSITLSAEPPLLSSKYCTSFKELCSKKYHQPQLGARTKCGIQQGWWHTWGGWASTYAFLSWPMSHEGHCNKENKDTCHKFASFL